MMRKTIAAAMSRAPARRISRSTWHIVAYPAGASVPGAVDLQVAGLEPGPQDLLVELAHGGLGHLVDERPVFRHLPAGHLAVQERGQGGRVGRGAGVAEDDAGQRAFGPLVVRDADDRGLS